MELNSTAIPDGSVIGKRYIESGLGGDNVSPDLTWSQAPADTKSFAVTCYDPDAPTGSGFWHWVGFDLPATVTHLAEGQSAPREWVNDYGYIGYGGAYPPPGPAHRYVFTIHALDVDKLDPASQATNAQVRFAINTHTLDKASLTGTYGQ